MGHQEYLNTIYRKKSLYLNTVQKMMLFLVSAYSIVESKRAHSGLLRTVFKSFGNKKLARLER